jgi:hypothetical protein
MRRLVMLVAAVAATLVPTGPAGAAGSAASCFHTWTDTASPGVAAIPGRTAFTSNGEKWELLCQGTARGFQVTGPGTFGEDGVINGNCSSGSGEVNFSFSIPTSGGLQKFRLSFAFVYGPGGGTSRTSEFPGVFAFYPTAGDCLHAPVTEFRVVRTGTLFS